MGKHSEPKEIPADKLAENLPPAREPNGFSKLGAMVSKINARRLAAEEAREKAEEELDRKTWNKFRKTALGKAWVRWRNARRKTKSGRIVLSAIYLTMAAATIALTLLVRPAIGWIFDSNVGHIELTAAQISEGYYEGCSGKYCSTKDGAAYRDMTDSEKSSSPDCLPNANECIEVVPLQRECKYVTVVIDEYLKADDWFSADRLFLEKYPEGQSNFTPGKNFVFSITGLQAKYKSWSIDQVRCDY